MSIVLNNIYYKENKEVKGYKDIFLDTSAGMLQVYVATIDFTNSNNIHSMYRLDEIDDIKIKYGDLNIIEVRRSYDNNMYLLILGEVIIAIEYILNSNFEHSIQEIRIIEDIHGSNKFELEEFKDLEIVELPR